MLAAVFLSGGSILPFYFIAGDGSRPTKPRALEMRDREEQQFWQGVRARRRAPPATSARG